MNDDTIVACLPTAFGRLHSTQESLQGSQAERTSRLRFQTLQAFHVSIELSLAPLQNVDLRGMPNETRPWKQVLLYIVLASYIANILEAKGLLGIERGSSITTLSPICEAKKP